MFKSILVLAGVVATASAQSVVQQIGVHAGEFNLGFCLAFQDNPDDTTTSCYASCQKTQAQLAKMFDVTQYSGGQFNTAQLMNFLQEAQMIITGQFTDCKTTEFLFSLDNRLSDTAFLSGLIANAGTQISTYAAYAVAASQTSGSI